MINKLHKTLAPLATLACFGLALLGCPTEQDDDDSAGDDDDTTNVETGCILLNGVEPGYARLADALVYAQDGDAITICAGEFVGSVVVERAVSITGAGVGQTTLVGDTNAMAVTVTAAGVTLDGLSIQSSRNGVVAANVTGLTLQNLDISGTGQYAIAVEGGAVTVDNVIMAGNPFAAINAQFASVTVTNSQITNGEGYGIRLVDSVASISDTLIEGVAVPESSDEYDGTCIYAEESTGALVLDNVDLSGCARVAIYTFDTDIQMTHSSVVESNYAIVAIAGSEDGSVITDNTFTDIPVYAVYLMEMDADISRNEIISSNAIDEDSIGIYVGNTDGTFIVEDNVVEGYKRYGIIVQPQYDPEPSGGTAQINRNTVRDCTWFGIWAMQLDELWFTNNTVDGIAWSTDMYDEYTYYIEGGVLISDVEQVTMAENVIQNVELIGLYISNSTFTSEDDEITETQMWAGYVADSAGTIDNIHVHDLDINGFFIYTASVDVTNSTFEAMRDAVPPNQWDLPEEEQYAYGGPGIQYYEAQGLVTGNTFQDNEDRGLYIYAANVTAENNEFYNNYYGVYFSGNADDGYPILIQNNIFGDHGWTAMYGYRTDAQVTNNVFSGPNGMAFYSSSFYGSFDNNEITTTGTAIQTYTYDIADMLAPSTYADNTFAGCASGITSSYFAGELVISGNSFEAVQSPIFLNDYYPGDESLLMVDNTFVDTPGIPIVVEDYIELTISGANVISGTTSGTAVDLQNITLGVVDGLTVSGCAGDALTLTGGDYTVTASSLTAATGAGIVADGSLDVDLDGTVDPVNILLDSNLAVSANGTHGIRLVGTVTGDINGNTIEDNTEYGIACDGSLVTLTSCSNTQSGNLLGDYLEQNGCVLGCTLE